MRKPTKRRVVVSPRVHKLQAAQHRAIRVREDRKDALAYAKMLGYDESVLATPKR